MKKIQNFLEKLGADLTPPRGYVKTAKQAGVNALLKEALLAVGDGYSCFPPSANVNLFVTAGFHFKAASDLLFLMAEEMGNTTAPSCDCRAPCVNSVAPDANSVAPDSNSVELAVDAHSVAAGASAIAIAEAESACATSESACATSESACATSESACANSEASGAKTEVAGAKTEAAGPKTDFLGQCSESFDWVHLGDQILELLHSINLYFAEVLPNPTAVEDVKAAQLLMEVAELCEFAALNLGQYYASLKIAEPTGEPVPAAEPVLDPVPVDFEVYDFYDCFL